MESLTHRVILQNLMASTQTQVSAWTKPDDVE